MSETTDYIPGVQVFGVTPEQVTGIVAGLDSAGVGPVEVVKTPRVPLLEGTSHVCIKGRCYPHDGNCFAKAVETVLPATSGVRRNIYYCRDGHCHKEY